MYVRVRVCVCVCVRAVERDKAVPEKGKSASVWVGDGGDRQRYTNATAMLKAVLLSTKNNTKAKTKTWLRVCAPRSLSSLSVSLTARENEI